MVDSISLEMCTRATAVWTLRIDMNWWHWMPLDDWWWLDCGWFHKFYNSTICQVMGWWSTGTRQILHWKVGTWITQIGLAGLHHGKNNEKHLLAPYRSYFALPKSHCRTNWLVVVSFIEAIPDAVAYLCPNYAIWWNLGWNRWRIGMLFSPRYLGQAKPKKLPVFASGIPWV